MDEFIEILQHLENYVKAIEVGFTKFIQYLPIAAEQHIHNQANQLLNSTKDNYVLAVSSKVSESLLVVTLNADNWLANAVESGVGAFEMKPGHLASSKIHVSAEGHRYIRIPMGQSASRVTSGTDKGREFQKRILDVIGQKKFGIRKLSINMDGSVASQEQVLGDPGIGGLYRVQKFESAESFHGRGMPTATQYILFRTMSDKPGTSDWKHPGIKPVYIFRETESWLGSVIEAMAVGFIEAELKRIGA